MRLSARSLVLALIVAVLGGLFAASPWGNQLEREIGLVGLFRWRGVLTPPGDAVIVALDRRSAEAIGLAQLDGAWPRDLLAGLIERIDAAGVRAIALDLFFRNPSDPARDAALEAAIRRAGKVAIVGQVMGESEDEAASRLVIERHWVQGPVQRFADAAASIAPFSLPDEGTVSGVEAFRQFAGGQPTLPAAALLIAAQGDGGLAALAPATPLPEPRPNESRAMAFMHQVDALRHAFLTGRAGPESGPGPADPGLARLRTAARTLLAGPDGYLLRPYGPRGQVRWIPAHRVLAGEPEALAGLRDRTVFVGMSDARAISQEDSYATAFRGERGEGTAGVEIAATAYLNYLDGGRLLIPAPLTLALASAGLGGGLVLAIARWRLRRVLVTGLGLLVLILAGAKAAFDAGIWLPVAVPLLAIAPMALLAGIAGRYGMLQQQIEELIFAITRGRVRRADPWGGLEEVGARQERWMVCLATDLESFVTLTESLPLQAGGLAELIAGYRSTIQAVVERHGGTVLDFAGDASICIFEGDAPSPEIRQRALKAACSLAASLERYAHNRGVGMRLTRMGLAEGTAVIGNLSETGFTYGALGSPLNTAGRLEQLNKEHGTRILATAAVLEGVTGIVARPIGAVRLKGRSGPEQIVAVECPGWN